MTSADRLLQGNLTNVSPAIQERGRELEELGLCRVLETEYIFCVHPADNDYDRVYDHDCDARIELDGDEGRSTRCQECGRDIILPDKERHTRIDIERSNDGVYDFLSDLAREALDTNVQKKYNGLKYLDCRIEPVMEFTPGAKPANIQLLFEPLPSEIIDAIRLFDRNTVTILVGTATNNLSEFDDRNLPYLESSELIDTDRETALQTISDVVAQVIGQDRLSDVGLKTDISKRLYSNVRQDLSWRNFWREYEHCTQNILLHIFTTSRLLGGEESGVQVPDGILTLNWDNLGQAYIWDAKYAEPSNIPRDLSGDYEDIAKHLVQFRQESNVRDIFNDVAGFLLISPGITSSSVVRLAERIQQRLEENGDQWGGPVVHLRFEALLELYDIFRANNARVQEKPRELRRHTHRLFHNVGYHTTEPDEYQEADVNVIDVDTDDIQRMIQQRVEPQEIEEDEINIEGYLANINSLGF